MKKYITSGLLILASLSFAHAQVTDIDTSNTKSCAIISQNLHYFSFDINGSNDVSILQDFLNTQGYLKSQPTGFFGSATRRAVIAFQNDNGLRATPPGYVGPATRAKIQEIDCKENSNTSVNTKLPKSTLSVNHLNIIAGQPVSITYQVSNASYCDATGGWSGTYYAPVGKSDWAGDKGYFYPTTTTTYGFTCHGSNGTYDNQSITVKVEQGDVIPPAPTIPTASGTPDTTFQISSPAQGATLTAGQAYSTSWYAGAGNVADSYQVYLVDQKGNNEWTYLGVAYQAKGSFTFTLPTNTKESVYVLNFSGKGISGGNSKMFNVIKPSYSTDPVITSFGNKDPDYRTGSTTIIWNTSKPTNVSLDMVCTPGSISFVTDKGNYPTCEKGGVWFWQGQSTGTIVVAPLRSKTPFTVPFTLTISNQNGAVSQKQTINVTFAANFVDIMPISTTTTDTSFQILPLDNYGIPVTAGQKRNVCWKYGKDNKNELMSFVIGRLDAQKGDGSYKLGSAYLSQGCQNFTIPSNLTDGAYLISANNVSNSLYANSPTFTVKANVLQPTLSSASPNITVGQNFTLYGGNFNGTSVVYNGMPPDVHIVYATNLGNTSSTSTVSGSNSFVSSSGSFGSSYEKLKIVSYTTNSITVNIPDDHSSGEFPIYVTNGSYPTNYKIAGPFKITIKDKLPPVTASFTYNHVPTNYDGKTNSNFYYKINNYKSGSYLNIVPTIYCNDTYIAPLKRECGNYVFDIYDAGVLKYKEVSGDPYVKGGSVYTLPAKPTSNIAIVGKIKSGYTKTTGLENPVPDRFDFRFSLVEASATSSKEVWSKIETVYFKG